MNFECSQCGECCRRAGLIPGFPEPVDDKGVCVHLAADATCSIYDERPTICRVAEMRRRAHPEISEAVYFRATARICNRWIREAGLDKKFLLDPGIYTIKETNHA